MAGEIKKLSFPDGVIVDEPTDIDLFGTGSQENLTEWVSYTPIITAETVNPTPADDHTLTGRWRRVGDSMEVAIAYNHDNVVGAASGTGSYFFSLPPGYNIDGSKLAFNTVDSFGDTGSIVGGNAFVQSGSTYYQGSPFWLSSFTGTTTLGIVVGNFASGITNVSSNFAAMDSQNQTQYQLSAIVPIVEFAGSQASLLGFTAPTDTTLGLAGPSGKVAIPAADISLAGGLTITQDIIIHYARSGDVFVVSGYAYLDANTTIASPFFRIPFADIPFLDGFTVDTVHGVVNTTHPDATNGFMTKTFSGTDLYIGLRDAIADSNKELYFNGTIYVGS